MDEKRFYGMPLDEVDRIRSEGQELVPIGRNVPWGVTEEIIATCIPDPERRLHAYKAILETLRKESAIPKTFLLVTPEGGNLSMKVVDLEAYRNNKQLTQE